MLFWIQTKIAWHTFLQVTMEATSVNNFKGYIDEFLQNDRVLI